MFGCVGVASVKLLLWGSVGACLSRWMCAIEEIRGALCVTLSVPPQLNRMESNRCSCAAPFLFSHLLLLFCAGPTTGTGVPAGDGKAGKTPAALAPSSVEVRKEQERRRHQRRPRHRRDDGSCISVVLGAVLRRSRGQRRRLFAQRADGAPGVPRAPAAGAPPNQAKDSLRGF